jgi:hypothetical protein
MMLSNTYAEVVPLLKAKKFNIDVGAFLNFLVKYKSGDYIYPSALHRRLGIDIKIIYEILEIYCPNCSKFTGQCFNNVQDIPDEVNCLHCGEDIEHSLKNAIVIYRML